MAKGRGGRGGGAGPAPFLTKTYQMVEERATDEVISWAEPGRNFVVWKPVEFARDLLPIHFKHCNFSSFVRQLNTYGNDHLQFNGRSSVRVGNKCTAFTL